MRLRDGTNVDAASMMVASSTKNRAGERNPEMRQVRKGNQYHFGLVASGSDGKPSAEAAASAGEPPALLSRVPLTKLPLMSIVSPGLYTTVFRGHCPTLWGP